MSIQLAEFPELVFALVGPVGTENDSVEDALKKALADVGYAAETIRLSALLREIDQDLPEGGPLDVHYERFMEAGTKLCESTKMADAVARLGITKLRDIRSSKTGDPKKPKDRCAYIFRSLKRPEEVQLLRLVYGQGFFLIGAFAPEEIRVSKLAADIGKSRNEPQTEKWRATALSIIVKDEEESGRRFGQRSRDTFHLSDIFVDASNAKSVKSEITRLIELIFGHPFVTPTVPEYAMFAARGAALRSGDLSRQVGAVVVDGRGHMLASGCNEVPRFGGGAYWATDPNDFRDYLLGYDPSAKTKEFMFRQVLARLNQAGWFQPEYAKLSPDQMIALVQGGAGATHLAEGIQLFDVLEFGRVVHAEMAAICEAALRGISIKGAALYSTTFPCHLCARLIVASGIEEVVYIEPYTKSRVKDLYSDSISIGDSDAGAKVRFRSFRGIAPTRYADLFAMPKRKSKDGTILPWKPISSSPRFQRFEMSYLLFEELAMVDLDRRLRENGVGSKKSGGISP